ncbi:permease-like cell division protein FtsX [Oscillospiraceae bacterium OttesenSCG-928-F05]|nr:permease-like cell division protein FtsX [Oscillospiraceae bacterium OttesenSCG-928-F05]
MKGHNILYFMREGVKSIFLHGFMSFAAITVIVACLIIVGSFSLLAMNVGAVIDTVASENEIIAFVDESLSESEAKSVGSAINRTPNIASAIYVSKEQALEDFSQSLDDDDKFLVEGLDEDNPLVDRYRVFLEDITAMDETVEALKVIPGIDKVRASTPIAEGVISMRNVVNAISYVLGIVLLAVSVFIISNTVKLATFDRREEIAIMKMVGATNAFIRWPFVFEGFMLGMIGGLIAFFLQWGIYHYAAESLFASIQMVQLIEFGDIAGLMLVAFVLVGFFVGIGGSLLTIRKFMKV